MKPIFALKIITKDWQYGDIVSISLKLKKDSVAVIYWGDAKTSRLFPSPYGTEWSHASHSYNCRSKCYPYTIVVTTANAEDITAISCGVMEVDVEAPCFIDCRGLQEFVCSNLPSGTRFVNCPNLKRLSCHWFAGEEIHLEALPKLEELDCRYSNISKINISRNNKLKKLVCRCCNNLKSIGLSNNSALQEVVIPQYLSDKSLHYLRRIVENNCGIITDDSMTE